MSESHQIWVDADACPVAIREILSKAAIKRQVKITFVANHSLPLPNSPFLNMRQVSSGFDVADNYIVQQAQANDLVISSDIPLAAELIEKGAQVISSRGEVFDQQNIRQRLNMRDFIETLRASGEPMSGGQSGLSNKDKQAFAAALDTYISRYLT